MHTIFNKQFSNLIEKIMVMAELSIGTLGPKTTSSYQALQYFIESLPQQKRMDYQEKLYDTFDKVLVDLVDKKVDLALVPSAYCAITEFFWNPELTTVYTFSFPTPEYGIVTKSDYCLKDNIKVRVASCKPVEFLLGILLGNDTAEHEFTSFITPSTTAALEAILEGNADLAITNETSYNKYANKYDIHFITGCFNTQMVWSIFSYKDFYAN